MFFVYAKFWQPEKRPPGLFHVYAKAGKPAARVQRVKVQLQFMLLLLLGYFLHSIQIQATESTDSNFTIENFDRDLT